MGHCTSAAGPRSESRGGCCLAARHSVVQNWGRGSLAVHQVSRPSCLTGGYVFLWRSGPTQAIQQLADGMITAPRTAPTPLLSAALGVVSLRSSITFAWRVISREVRASAMGASLPWACATKGIILPCKTPRSGGPWPYCLHFATSAWQSAFLMATLGLVDTTFTSTQSCRPSFSMILTSTLWIPRTAPGASAAVVTFALRPRPFATGGRPEQSDHVVCHVACKPVPNCKTQHEHQRGPK